MARGERTWSEGQRIAWIEAHRQMGRKHWRWYVYGRLLVRPLLALALGALVVGALWYRVPHSALAAVCGVAGFALTAGGALRHLSVSGARARMLARAGASSAGAGLTTIMVFAGCVLLILAVAILRLS
jgi:hypothetical protein